LAAEEGHMASVAGKKEVLSAYFIRYFILAWLIPLETASVMNCYAVRWLMVVCCENLVCFCETAHC